MKRHQLTPVAIFAFTAPALALAQFKCVDSVGKTSFQQTACASSERAERLSVPQARPVDEAAAAGVARRQLVDLERQAAVARAIRMGYPIVGMSVTDLNSAMGSADKVNNSNYGRGLEQQAIYYRNGRTFYVYTAAGVVTAIQDTDGGGYVGPAKPPCPSSRERANEYTSLGSITVSDKDRTEGRRRLDEKWRHCE